MNFLKNSAGDNKSIKNYPAFNVLFDKTQQERERESLHREREIYLHSKIKLVFKGSFRLLTVKT